MEGKVEIDSDKRRLLVILDKQRLGQLWIPLYSIKQVLAVDPPQGQPQLDLVFVLSHAPHIFASRQRQQAIDRHHRELGQVVNTQILVSFSSSNQRSGFLDEPQTGLPQPKRRKLKTVERHLYDKPKLAPVYALMRGLSSPVAFQVSSTAARLGVVERIAQLSVVLPRWGPRWTRSCARA